LTTQAVALTLSGSGNQGGRLFSGTATDGAYTAINSTTGTAELGFAMRGSTISNVSGVYAAGSGLWVIRNRVTQQIDRSGMMGKTGGVSSEGYPIAPLVINQNHILQVFTLAAGTSYLAWVGFTGKPPELFTATIADGATGELVTTAAAGAQGLGSFADQTISYMLVQAPDGKIVTYAQIIDGNGAEQFAQLGSERTAAGGYPKSGTINLCSNNLSFSVMRGMALNLTVAA
jgi:hypothetical protein